jgi:hypothetical protein
MKSERGIEYVAEKADTRHLNLDSSFDWNIRNIRLSNYSRKLEQALCALSSALLLLFLAPSLLLEEIRGWWNGLFTCESGMVMEANRRAIWRSMAVPCFGHPVPRCHMLSAMPSLGFEPWISSRWFGYIAS